MFVLPFAFSDKWSRADKRQMIVSVSLQVRVSCRVIEQGAGCVIARLGRGFALKKRVAVKFSQTGP